MMVRKIILWCIWLGFVAYTIWLAPLDRADTWSLAQKLLTLQWGKLNAIVPAIFCLMGVWPTIYACLMFADGRMQNFRAFPYFIGSNFTGVICLLPYLIFRRSNQEFYGQKDKWLEILDRRSTGVFLLVGTIGILAIDTTALVGSKLCRGTTVLCPDYRKYHVEWAQQCCTPTRIKQHQILAF